jgi:hypothetical protein
MKREDVIIDCMVLVLVLVRVHTADFRDLMMIQSNRQKLLITTMM